MASKSINDLKPNDLVKSCKYIEMGSCFALDGVRCCVHGTIQSPLIVTAEELRDNSVSYDLVVQRKRELFAAINDLTDGPTDSCKTCAHLKEKRYKDVSFKYIGGERLPAGFNIQHYTQCNQRCTYCWYTQTNNFVKPQYSVLDYLELFRRKGKLRGNNWIDFSGGEPAILKDFDEILNYLLDNNLGTVVVYSNAVTFSQGIYDALKKNRIILTTSLDTGIASTYRKLRGVNTYSKVITNLIRYRNSGTSHLWIKYVVSDINRTEDDLWSFVLAMLALRPNNLMICPDFPYGEKQIPDDTVKFAARLWYILERLTGITPIDYTNGFGAPVWMKYHDDLRNAIQELIKQKPFGNEHIFQKLELNPVSSALTSRLVCIKNRVRGSGFRKWLLPEGSAREKCAVFAWRRTFGRLFLD